MNPVRSLDGLSLQELKVVRKLVAIAANKPLDEVRWVSDPPRRYLVTSSGQIWSFTLAAVLGHAIGYRMPWKINKLGEASLHLSRLDGSSRNTTPGRLVAEAFLGLKPGDKNKIVKHKDGHKLNCRARNLEILPAHEARRLDAKRTRGARYSHGTSVRLRKPNERGRGKFFPSMVRAAKALGVTSASIKHALVYGSMCRGYYVYRGKPSEDYHAAPPIPVKVTREDGTVALFPSMQQAEKEFGTTNGILSYHLNRHRQIEIEGNIYERQDSPVSEHGEDDSASEGSQGQTTVQPPEKGRRSLPA